MCLYDTVMVSDTTVLHDFHIPLSMRFYINILINFFCIFHFHFSLCFSHVFAIFIRFY